MGAASPAFGRFFGDTSALCESETRLVIPSAARNPSAQVNFREIPRCRLLGMTGFIAFEQSSRACLRRQHSLQHRRGRDLRLAPVAQGRGVSGPIERLIAPYRNECFRISTKKSGYPSAKTGSAGRTAEAAAPSSTRSTTRLYASSWARSGYIWTKRPRLNSAKSR